MRRPVTFEVAVGNIGVVHSGGKREAQRVFREYREQSRTGYGRAAGESVTLLRVVTPGGADIVREFIGSNDK